MDVAGLCCRSRMRQRTLLHNAVRYGFTENSEPSPRKGDTCHMAKTYRVNAFVRISNAMTTFLLRMGVKMGSMTLLTVRGRKSGKIRTNPVTLIELDGYRLLIAPFGTVNWVRNLRVWRGYAHAGSPQRARLRRRTEHPGSRADPQTIAHRRPVVRDQLLRRHAGLPAG